MPDLHADFLAFYGIDLRRDSSLSGPAFFALARRVFVYGGVMAARAREEQEDQQQPPAGDTATPPPASNGEQVVELSTFRALFPDLIS